jgi:hypothetical protein
MSDRRVTITLIAATMPTAEDDILECIQRDGVAIVAGMFSTDHIEQVKEDLASHFDSDVIDESGFLPSTTQRATGLFGISHACVDLAMHPLFLSVANRLLTSTYTFYIGSEKKLVTSKPIISSTVDFCVNPGGKQQELHRDDTGFHTRPYVIGQ